MKKFYFLVLWGILAAVLADGQVIISNTIQGTGIYSDVPYTGGVQVANPNALYNVIELGPGVDPAVTDDAYMGTNWTTANNIDIDNDYFEFSLGASQPEYVLRLVSFVYSAQVSADGPTAFAFRSSLDDYGSNVGVFIADNNSHTINLNLPAYQNLTDIIFRVYGWNAADIAGSFSINEFAFNGTVTSTYSLTTGAVATPPFNVTCVAGANGTVGFTAVGPYAGGGNVYTVQLSDAAGLFTTPTTIGSLNSDALSGTVSFTIPAGTGASNAYRVRLVSSVPAITGTVSSPFTVNSATCNTSLATDFFRSRVLSGTWNVPNSWESAHAAGGPWFTATLSPGATASSVLIQTGHTMVVNSSVTINKGQVSGLLQMLNNNGSNLGVITLADNPTDELVINNGGVFQIISSGPSYTAGGFNYGASSNIKVLTGGKILLGDGTAAHSTGGFERFSVDPVSKVYWGDGSILEWNSNGTTIVTNNVTFFPGATASEIPVFRLSLLMPTQVLGGNTPTTINGLLEVNTPASFTLGGSKIFRNGVTGTSVLTLNLVSAPLNSISITGADGSGNASPAIIGGSLTIVLNEHLRLSKGATVPVGAGVTVSTTTAKQIQKANGSLAVNGTLDLTNVSVTNTTGDVTVNGTLKTGSQFGLYGAGAAVLSGSLGLNSTTSTIEYNRAGLQAVQGLTVPLYNNLVISGSGVKTLQSANAMTATGTLTITGNAVFDAGVHTIGNPSSDLVMSGTSQFKIAGGGTKPDAGGSYILFPGTLIEFNGISATTIRLGAPTNYASVVVSGTNVSNPSVGTGLRFGTGGFFTVKSGGTFHLNSTAGCGIL